MLRLIYNPVELRLRAFWRLLLQGVIFLVLVTIMGVGLSLVLYASAAFSGQAITEFTPYAEFYRLATPLIALVAMLLSLYLTGKYLDRRPIKEFGLHLNPTWWRRLAFGLVLGAVLISLVFWVEYAAGWITITAFFQSSSQNVPFILDILQSVLLFVCGGIYEELFSRGYQLRNLAEGLNLRFISPRLALVLAYLVSSLVFGLLHAFNPNPTVLSIFNIFLAGLFLGLGFILTGDLAISIGIHITWNFFQGNVFGFPVSGTQAGASIIAIQQSGPVLWTGGAFGPEGGLIVILALLLGAAAIIAWVRATTGRVSLWTRLAEYQPGEPQEILQK